MTRAFKQVDVFTPEAYKGNPVAVVLEADGLTDGQMQVFTRWTNLSETTFVLPPNGSADDYRLRIFTPGGELPFAGHPTLGSAHAWLKSGGVPRNGTSIIQECGLGRITLKKDAVRLAFAAPALLRSGPLDDATLDHIVRSLRIERADVVGHQWADNGPGWAAVMLASAERVLDLRPDFAAMGEMAVGVVGPQRPPTRSARSRNVDHDADSRNVDHDADFEVRAFVPPARRTGRSGDRQP